MSNNEFFACVSNDVFLRATLPFQNSYTRQVLLLLETKAGASRVARFPVKELAKVCGCSRKTIRRAIARLVKLGFVSVLDRRPVLICKMLKPYPADGHFVRVPEQILYSGLKPWVQQVVFFIMSRYCRGKHLLNQFGRIGESINENCHIPGSTRKQRNCNLRHLISELIRVGCIKVEKEASVRHPAVVSLEVPKALDLIGQDSYWRWDRTATGSDRTATGSDKAATVMGHDSITKRKDPLKKNEDSDAGRPCGEQAQKSSKLESQGSQGAEPAQEKSLPSELLPADSYEQKILNRLEREFPFPRLRKEQARHLNRVFRNWLASFNDYERVTPQLVDDCYRVLTARQRKQSWSLLLRSLPRLKKRIAAVLEEMDSPPDSATENDREAVLNALVGTKLREIQDDLGLPKSTDPWDEMVHVVREKISPACHSIYCKLDLPAYGYESGLFRHLRRAVQLEFQSSRSWGAILLQPQGLARLLRRFEQYLADSDPASEYRYSIREVADRVFREGLDLVQAEELLRESLAVLGRELRSQEINWCVREVGKIVAYEREREARLEQNMKEALFVS